MLTGLRDQELRFTVHDSPDYYQLKVSVFNDDKKTELIGETWVALDQIIVPGGGQNDVWHNLNCKGKYAGEIRIELTYYDTRPREEKAEERRQSAPITGSMGQGNSSVNGPRQPKAVKRRPLPADPTGTSCTSPLPYTPPPINQHVSSPQQRYVESPDDYDFDSTSPTDRRHQRLQDGQSRGSPLGNNNRQPYDGSMSMAPAPNYLTSNQFDNYDPASQGDYRQDPALTHSQSPQNQAPYDQPSDYDTDYIDDWQSRPLTQPLQTSQGFMHSNSSPAMIDAQPRQDAPIPQHYQTPSLSQSNSYEESPTYQQSREDGYDAWQNTDGVAEPEQEAPPPPPVHRNSGSRSLPQSPGNIRPEPHAPIPATAPLNIRNGRGNSMTGSPLSQVQSNSSYMGYPTSTSPSVSHSYSNPAPSVSSRTSYNQLGSNRSHSPVRDFDQSVPPSLVPGYEPSIAEDESERIVHEKRMSAMQLYPDQPVPQYQQIAAPVAQPRPQPLPQYQQILAPEAQSGPQPLPQYQQAAAPTLQSRPQPFPRNIENIKQRRPHRASAPIVRPQPVSPDPQTPVRKSVSPQPGSAPTERRQSGIPFSPDSYDAFNPAISAASSVNEPGAKYNTPEQAVEASRQRERDAKLGDGPIIGNDGRIIDPSDHLPTDTWAPEPEQKAPRRGPEITVRFRHSPLGAQPMPAAGRRPLVETRPHAVSTPIYAHSPDNASPTSANRARLQKKSRAVMAQPSSSPIVPTLNTAPRNPLPRSSTLDYPLREHENYGGNGSPVYARTSPANIPPPIPGKVPIGSGQEDWGMSALSEEMKRIDIGVGGGQGRVRRMRFGA